MSGVKRTTRTTRTALVFGVVALLLAAGLGAAQEPKESSKQETQQEKQKPRTWPNRLYFGSPPTVPHEVGEDFAQCLVCHEADSMGPETPHPTRIRCRQCHVKEQLEAQVDTDFRANTFVGLPLPASRSPKVQPNGPPLIAHPVVLRENCLACHSPESGKDVLATTHPERERCRQCHVPQRWKAKPLPHVD